MSMSAFSVTTKMGSFANSGGISVLSPSRISKRSRSISFNYNGKCKPLILDGTPRGAFTVCSYLSSSYPFLQLLAIVKLNALPQLLHVVAVGQTHHICAHQTLQGGADARQIETKKVSHKITVNYLPKICKNCYYLSVI